MKKYIQPSIVVTEVRALSPLAMSFGGDGTGTAKPKDDGPSIDEEDGVGVRRESGLSWDIF